MPGVSEEQVRRAREVDLLTWLQFNEPGNFTHKNGEYRLKDHDSLTLSNGHWYWHSRGFGGRSALDYLIKVRGMGFVAAVEALCDNLQAPSPTLPEATRPECRRPEFVLPRRAQNNNRVTAYLQSRGISQPLIDRCIGVGILYESQPYHNAVFVGKDPSGTPRFACARGTLGNFRGDVAGSDKRFGFLLPPVSPAECSHLAVFESPIDALSHAELTGEDCHRLSLAGTTPLALMQFLEETHVRGQPKITGISLCLDNDAAGIAGMDAIEKLLLQDGRFSHIIITRDPATIGKDYNEALLASQRGGKSLEHSRHCGDLTL